MQKFVSSRDLLASIVVFLVALPLCMGIAIASGAPPALGLITGIVGGLVVGFLAGSPLQVSGPAAGLSVLVYQLVQEHGLAILGAVVLGAGAIQLTSGILKCGQWFRAISPSVIFGMLAGIGVLIFASQFHVMVDDEPRSSGIANLISIPAALYKGIFPIDGSTHHLAAFIGLLTIGTLIGWNYFRPRPLRMVPSALVAVVVASAAAWMLELPIRRIDVPANLLDGANWLTSEIFASLLEPAIMLQAAVFALVASAETLLCAAALDQMHDGKPTDFDRELRAQGIGNMICGVFGALPMTGVIVRSSANVQAGAETRASAILHGAWLLSAIAILPWLLNHIPTASLAAILVYTGYKLVDISKIRRIAGFGRIEIVIYVATVAGIVLTDLLTGVLIGFGLAIVKLAYTFSRLDVHATHSKDVNRVDLNLRGAATFLGLPRLAAALEQVPPGAELHVHIEHLDYIDHACMELLSSWEKRNERLGGKLKVEWDGLVDRCQRKKNQDPAERSDSHAATLAAMGRS